MAATHDVFSGLDLDAAAAARREGSFPDGIPVTYGGTVFTLPAELPAEALDPLLGLDVDMASIMAAAAKVQATASEAEARAAGGGVLIDALLANPNLPLDVVKAIKASLAVLFGPEQWEAFLAKKPSIPVYAGLVKGLWRAYGVSLGEAFASPASSAAAGETLNSTSSAPTDSTPAAPGQPPVAPASSESVV